MEALIVIKRKTIVHMIKWRWTQRWSMRLVQGNGQEKILVTILLQETDSPVTAAVRVGKALCHIRFKGSCPFSGFHPFLVSQLFQIAPHIIPVLLIPAFRTFSIAEIIATIQMPFANVAAMDLLVCQTLADGLDTLAKRHTIRGNTVTVREHTGKNGASGRTADWLAGISILITNSLLGQPIQIRRDHPAVTITAKHIFSCGVRHKKNHLFSFTHTLTSSFLFAALLSPLYHTTFSVQKMPAHVHDFFCYPHFL